MKISPLRWIALWALLLALILVPFFLWDEAITTWSMGVIEGSGGGGTVGTVIAGLLALDVLLPVPSSILSTASGFRFGVLGGAAISWVGMTIGCGLAYVIGARLGHGPSERLVGARALGRASAAMERHAIWILAAFRPVPVLAEASVLMAGLSRMPLAPFLRVTMLANLGPALVYAWVGARSADAGSFLFAVAGAMLFPAVTILAARALVPATDGSPEPPAAP